MNEDQSLPPAKRAGIAFATLLKALVRVLLILLAAILLGGLIYFAFVAVYQQALLPARENASRISLLETGQAQDALLLEQRLESFQQRLTSLENQRALTGESLEELIADQQALQDELDQQAVELQRLDELQAELENLRSYADKAYNLGIQAYQASVGKDEMINALERQIVVLKVAGLLNRSRLYMLQSNFGLARSQVVMARDLLVELQARSTPQQQTVISSWLGRLDRALDSLPESPVVAADELEIAWGLILRGLPEQFVPTPTAYRPAGALTASATPLRPPLTPTPTPPPFNTAAPVVSPTAYPSPTP